MAIPDPGAPYVYTQLDASSKTALIEALKTALVNSGWTLKQSDSASVTVTFTGLPANGNTVTFDGVVYTFRTVITQENPREVDIGADAAECASNLADAINEEAGTKGTAYSNSTTAHPTCTATDVTTACTVYGPNGFTASETLANATLNRTTASGLGYKLDSARCPSGLQMRLILDDDGAASTIRIRVATCDEATILTGHWRLAASAGRLLEFRGCKHEVETWLQGAYLEYGCNFQCGTPALHVGKVPPKIAAISDNAGEFQITTTLPHGMVTGEHVFIAGGTTDTGAGVSAINGDHQVTVQDSTHYTLDGSTYAAENYDADSALSGTVNRISRLFWAMGDDTAQRQHSFRTTTGKSLGTVSVNYGVACNQFSYSHSGYGIGPRIKIPVDDGSGEPAVNFGGDSDWAEARISWPIASYASQVETVGSMWGTAGLSKGEPMDKLKHAYQGFNWINYCHNGLGGGSRASLWLITGEAA